MNAKARYFKSAAEEMYNLIKVKTVELLCHVLVHLADSTEICILLV